MRQATALTRCAFAIRAFETRPLPDRHITRQAMSDMEGGNAFGLVTHWFYLLLTRARYRYRSPLRRLRRLPH
jgi:hypothetical protein